MVTYPDGIPLSDIRALRAAYEAGLNPAEVVEAVYARLAAHDESAVWITQVSRDDAMARAAALADQGPSPDLPLYGVPFAVKDNIDVAGLPTTAGCPAYGYQPDASAFAVTLLLEAGAILIGKTNLDQFATGLVGTRSPYGVPRCVFNRDYVSGGSSSGSGVAVAAGLVSFALGTDTAGSGRVPAAFNDLVGLKPSRGLVSTRGVVPACRSLDCVSVFASDVSGAGDVLQVLASYDADDPYAREFTQSSPVDDLAALRIGVPQRDQLDFFGDDQASQLWEAALRRATSAGAALGEFDLSPYDEAARILYEGAWVAERTAAVGEFLKAQPGAAHPVVRNIILGGWGQSATQLFHDQHRLAELQRQTQQVWRDVDLLLLPTTGTIYRVADVLAEPYALNANLGRYTNFVNLLDLSAIALPAGFRANHTPFGITAMAPAGGEELLLAWGAEYEQDYRSAVTAPPLDHSAVGAPGTLLAVVGAHLSGQPLNRQLTERNAALVYSGNTAPHYRLYALANSTPPKPGLVHVGPNDGAAIELEVWSLSLEAFGSFVAEVPPPLAIGSVELDDGRTVNGFVCEPRALEGALDVTHFGGWRGYRAAQDG